jgi:hypothetical protein
VSFALKAETGRSLLCRHFPEHDAPDPLAKAAPCSSPKCDPGAILAGFTDLVVVLAVVFDSGSAKQRVSGFRPESPQDHPEQLVGGGDLWARIPLPHNDKLLAKSQVLKQQVAARAKSTDKEDSQKPQQPQHQVSIIRGQTKLGHI